MFHLLVEVNLRNANPSHLVLLVMPGPRKSSGSGGSRKSTSSPKKKPKMMTSGDENGMSIDKGVR